MTLLKLSQYNLPKRNDYQLYQVRLISYYIALLKKRWLLPTTHYSLLITHYSLLSPHRYDNCLTGHDITQSPIANRHMTLLRHAIPMIHTAKLLTQ